MYDVIVIGAGNGGLVSALTLQRQGKKVLLLEKNAEVGGVATSFVRGRFEFEASLYGFFDYGVKEQHGALYDLFEKLHLTDKIDFESTKEVQIVTSNEKYRLPFGIPNFLRQMEEYVPGSSSSIERFLEWGKEASSVLSYLMDSPFEEAIILEKFPHFAIFASLSTLEGFEKLEIPKKAQELLSTFWIYFGSPIKMLSFVHFASFFYSYICNGGFIPKERSHAISLLLAEEFEALGGTIRCLSKVQEILLQEQEISGVLCEDGELFYSKHLIANMSPNQFYGSLLPMESRTKRMNQICNARTIGPRSLVVYLGLNKSATDLGLHHYCYFFPDCFDLNLNYKDLSFRRKDGVAYVLNQVNSNGSVSNTTILCLEMIFFDSSSNVFSESNYFEKKNEMARELIEIFENTLHVDIQSSIEEIEIATPVTFAYYTGHPDGTHFGYMARGYDNLMARFLHETEENYLKNMHFCGSFGSLLSSYHSSYLSGYRAAINTLKDIGTEGEIYEREC